MIKEQLRKQRSEIMENAAKLVYDIDNSEIILPIAMKIEQYQKQIIDFVMANSRSEIVPMLLPIVADIKTAIENKDWFLLYQVISLDLKELEEAF